MTGQRDLTDRFLHRLTVMRHGFEHANGHPPTKMKIGQAVLDRVDMARLRAWGEQHNVTFLDMDGEPV